MDLNDRMEILRQADPVDAAVPDWMAITLGLAAMAATVIAIIVALITAA